MRARQALPLVFALLGLVGSIAGVVATIRNLRELSGPRRPVSRLLDIAAAVGGIVLAFVCYHATYSYSDTMRIWGFPFSAAVFEKHGNHWLDFVGPVTGPAAVGNAIFGLVLPQLGVRTLRRVHRRARSTTKQSH
jgi:hypothetical protein